MTKPKRLKLVRLKRPNVDPDQRFITTLVWLLDQARQGNAVGYAVVAIIRSEERTRTIEAASVIDDDDIGGRRLQLLGAMRGMEHNFIKREYEDDVAHDYGQDA